MSRIISNMREKGNKVDETYVIDKKDQKPIEISFWSNSGKFFIKELIPAGLKNNSIS